MLSTYFKDKISNDYSRPKFNLLCLGGGDSAFFLAALSMHDSSVMFLTSNPQSSTRVKRISSDQTINFTQTDSPNHANEFIVRGIAQKIPTIIAVTSDVIRGKYWFDELMKTKLFSDLIYSNSVYINFLLPQSPNIYKDDFIQTGCPVVMFDYFPAVVALRHEANGIAVVEASIKENTNYVVMNASLMKEKQRQNFDEIIRYLSGSKELIEYDDPQQINMPNNSIMNIAGVISHIVGELVDRQKIDPMILKINSLKDFFSMLNFALIKLNKGIFAEIADSLKDRRFYCQMPEIGPNVLMIQLSDIVSEIRKLDIKKGSYPPSSFDFRGRDSKFSFGHIVNHLKSKYAFQYMHSNNRNPYQISFAEFISKNPAYQNPKFVFPTDSNGYINTKHRFFNEDLANIIELKNKAVELNLNQEKIAIFENIINFVESLKNQQKIANDSVSSFSLGRPFAAQKLSHSLRSRL